MTWLRWLLLAYLAFSPMLGLLACLGVMLAEPLKTLRRRFVPAHRDAQFEAPSGTSTKQENT
jgi:hypothetical protein